MEAKYRFSIWADKLLSLQKTLIGCLLALTVLLILLNVATRAFSIALFWVDELAIYSMIWAFMLGAACTVRTREGIEVTLVRDVSSTILRRNLTILSDCLTLVCSVILLITCWRWFDLLLLYETGFDLGSFVRKSFNFVYREPTSTLGIAKFWVWLIMPVMGVSLFLFSIANLLDSVAADPTEHERGVK